MEQNIAETPVLFNAWAWIEKNRKQVIFGVVAVAAIGAVVGYSNWAAREKQINSGRELSRALVSPEARQGGKSAADALLKVAAANSGTEAGAQSVLLAANELFQAGNYPEAQSTFEQFRKDYPSHQLNPQAAYGSASALAAQGKWDEAARAYKECADRYATAPVAAYAKFSLAQAYEKQGQPEAALPLYQEILRDGERRSIMMEAAQRVEALLPKLAPPLPPTGATTNSPVTQPK